jgi:hypothetical protein
MRRRVSYHRERSIITISHDRNRLSIRQWKAKITGLAIYLHSNRCTRKAFTNAQR